MAANGNASGVWLGLALTAAVFLAGCSGDDESKSNPPSAVAKRAIVEVQTVLVADAGNAPVAIVPFHPGIYQTCADAPSRHSGCRTVGKVGYAYEIGRLEVTVSQYVDFLNTVDPSGTNRRDLYISSMSPTAWPKYGPIRRDSGQDVASGAHYAVAYPEWADKPIGFADFPRAASFANALTNGDVLSRTTSTKGGFQVTTYRVRLSSNVDTGMYDLRATQDTQATRARATGFVVPSQDEWIKAAYYDRKGGGTFSYWMYPTGPSKAPLASQLNDDGDVVNAGTQPLSTFSPRGSTEGSYPTWCPTQAGDDCETVNPFGLDAQDYQSKYRANLSSVGQTRTTSPWGTLDQGGNVVEWTDTTAPPLRSNDRRTWRWAHGGVANAPAYQLWISAVGRLPETVAVVERVNPWDGFRIGVIGKLGS